MAVIGATERQGASSGFVMRNLIDHGYAGEIYPIHPRAEELFGFKAVPNIERLGKTPDVAVICIAAEYVAGALEDAGRQGVKAAIILSSGFAEKDEEGHARQIKLADIANRYGMAVCGPNCLGLVALHANTVLYSSRFPTGVPKGEVALLSQSGASAIALSATGRIGFSIIISSGNSAVTDIPDYLHFLAADPSTRIVMLVLENIRDPEEFAAAVREMHLAGKPVIALYIGRSERGAAATAAHTGALAGSFDAVQAFFRRNGIVSVDTLDELLETAALFSAWPHRPQNGRLGIIGVSGGGVAHVSDLATAVGLKIPSLQAQTVRNLREILPSYTTPQNPLDTTGLPFADGDVYRQAVVHLADDSAIDVIAAVQDVPPGLDEAGAREYLPIARGIVDYARTGAVPLVVISNLSDGHHPLFGEPLQNAGVPLLKGTEVALKAIKNVLRPKPVLRGDVSASSHPHLEADDRWLTRFKEAVPLTEREAKQFLAACGIRTTREGLATTAPEAAALAEEIGFPVVMKIESPDILHKSDAGGVLLGVDTPAAAQEAFDQITAAVSARMPQADLRGVVVQEMITGGVEAFAGLTRHPPFGFGAVVGPGGTLVELMGETAFDLLPLDEKSVESLIKGTRLDVLLSGFRGASLADRPALIEAIVKLGHLVALYGDYLEAIELNPIAVLPEGQGICVLDAVIIPKTVYK